MPRAVSVERSGCRLVLLRPSISVCRKRSRNMAALRRSFTHLVPRQESGRLAGGGWLGSLRRGGLRLLLLGRLLLRAEALRQLVRLAFLGFQLGRDAGPRVERYPLPFF